MAKAAIIEVDDEPVVLNAVDRDLGQKYGPDYRILKVDSGAAGFEVVRQLHARDEEVALFVSDQRMPEMSGVQFLRVARPIFPNAKRVLLTAYADTDAAIASINQVGIDYYLMKPWDPPSENLYPILDELLEDWKANAQPSYDGIRVVGALWSPESHEVKDFLARHQVAYQWLDVDLDPKARELVERRAAGATSLPVIFFPDGSVLVSPSIHTLAERTGFATHASRPFYGVIIIGGGPAGLAAAVYGASEGARCLVIEQKALGGQAGYSPKIENYLGFPAGISGMDLARHPRGRRGARAEQSSRGGEPRLGPTPGRAGGARAPRRRMGRLRARAGDDRPTERAAERHPAAPHRPTRARCPGPERPRSPGRGLAGCPPGRDRLGDRPNRKMGR